MQTIDIVIPCHPKDYPVLGPCIDSVRRFVPDAGEIFVLSREQPPPSCFPYRVTWIPEDDYDFSREDCERLIASAPRVDVLVSNAGFGIYDPIERANVRDLESMMQTNYFGAVYCTHAVLPQMLQRRAGAIVIESPVFSEAVTWGFPLTKTPVSLARS